MGAGAVTRASRDPPDRPDGHRLFSSIRRFQVTQPLTENIRLGWKVFAGPDAIGEVAYIKDHELGVKSGRLIKHEYVIPIDYVSDAADGVVDLKIGRDAVTELKPIK
jgi:hypothetical protein